MNTYLNKISPSQGNIKFFLRLGFIFFLASANALAGNVKFTWNASTSSGVGGYKLYYGQSSKSYSSNIDVGNTTSYTISGLTDGGTYFFALKAYNTAKSIESSYSNEVSATVSATSTITVSIGASATSGAAPLVTTLSGSATGGTVSSWKWDFGDGTASTAQNASKTYSVAGSYVAKLTVNAGTTNSASASKTITVSAPVVTTPPPTTTVTTNPAGLVAAYSFQDYGTTTADASGNDNHAVISGAVKSYSGYDGMAMKFDGVEDWLTVNDSASLDLTKGMTLEAWLYPQTQPNDYSTAIMKESSTGTVYNLNATTDANLPGVTFYNNGSYNSTNGPQALPVNKWSHLVATYDGSYQRVYVNGVQVAARAQTGLIPTSSGALRIGGNSIWGNYFTGLIDEVRIYNRALTGDEVKYDYLKSVSASNPPQFFVGNKTLESNVDSTAQGQAEAFKTTPQKTAMLTELQVYLDGSSTATELWAGVYSDNNGHPGTLLTQGKQVSPKAGATNYVPITTAKLTQGNSYWIAILGSKGQVKFRARGGASNPTETSSSTALTSLPQTWTTGQVFSTGGPLSAYGTGY